MIKLYAKREIEKKILEHLKEFKVIGLRIVTSFPIEGVTRKVKGSNEHKVMTKRTGAGACGHYHEDKDICPDEIPW